MKNDIARVVRTFWEFLFLAALAIAVPAVVYVDCVVLRHGVPEHSVTEHMQDAMLLLSAILFGVGAWRRPEARGFLTLVSGFFTCMLIREQNNLLDAVCPGFWLYPALLVAGVSIACAMLWHRTILAPMADYTETRSYVYVSLGLVIVLLFSQIFGSGQLLWIDIMGADYKRLYKTILQEGLELFGYIFIFYGSCLLPRKS